MKTKINVEIILQRILAVATILVIVWSILSYIEIMVHNDASIIAEPFTYSKYNLFRLIFQK